ncbi:MAG: hypothetical protein N4A63_14505 [Vallitalea sp.]|jgi:D-alanyl-lipoteichoic acid acyltransferase DltB (MBOAT superfamily)|nr:hypothetical protein [Vallitalea sp.]
MLNGIIVIIIFVIIAVVEIIPLKRNKKKKEITIYSIFFTIAFVLMFSYSIGIELPQISKMLDSIIEKII